MKQSRATSFLKSLVSTVVGFAIAMVANALVLPLFGFTPSLSENFLITCIYTVISVVRGYALERAFEAVGWRTRMSAFALAVLAERQRQITEEGWTVEDDDEHEPGEMARASAAYALQFWVQVTDAKTAAASGDPEPTLPRRIWPWQKKWWKPDERPRRNAVKSGALMLAEGEKFDRARKRKVAA
jgi:hypothetical protein